MPAVSPQEVLRANDRLLFVGIVESVVDLQRIRGLLPATDQVSQAQRAAAAALPDRGRGVEQLPAGGQDDSRRAVSQRLQRGGRGRGPQRRAVAKEDRRHRAAGRRHAAWSRPIPRSPISSATRATFFWSAGWKIRIRRSHDRALLAVGLLIGDGPGRELRVRCRCCKASHGRGRI